MLVNKITNHTCLIQKGWREIRQIFSEVENTDAINSMLKEKTEFKQLVDFLVMHRVLEYKGIFQESNSHIRVKMRSNFV